MFSRSFAFVFALAALAPCCGERPADDSILIDTEKGEVVFEGTIFPNRYNTRGDRVRGHHFVVWKNGRAALKALIQVDVKDRRVLEALEAIGAEPGNNLTVETWRERSDPDSPEPDKRVEGTPAEFLVSWNGHELPAWRLFQETTAEDIDLRVGGHAELAHFFGSGCVACLFSCPGGRTSNRAYTLRDQVEKRRVFVADESRLPPDGTRVTVRIRLVRE